MYVRKAIENLLQHKDIKRSSHHELKLACEEALKALEVAVPNTNNNAPSGPDSGKNSEIHFLINRSIQKPVKYFLHLSEIKTMGNNVDI